MARITHPGKRTFWHLAGRGRVPNDYEIKSTALLYARSPHFEVETPVAAWIERVQSNSLALPDWDDFVDPERLTYAAYVARRRDDEVFAERLLADDDAACLFQGDGAARRRELYRRSVAPLRFACHGLQLASAYVAERAPGSRIVIAALFQSADELRRIQRLAYRLRQVELVDGPIADDARGAWLEDPAWQRLRRLIETLLVTYDWSEAFAALNLVVKPVLDELFSRELGSAAEKAGDHALALLLGSLYADALWHRSWALSLARTLVAARAENRAALRRAVELWQPRLWPAVEAVAPLFADGSNGALAPSLAARQRETLLCLELD